MELWDLERAWPPSLQRDEWNPKWLFGLRSPSPMGDKKCIKPLAFGGPRYGTMSCEMSFLVKMYVFISGGSCRPPNFSQYCYALLEKMEKGEMGRLDFISFHQKGGNLAEDQIDVVRRLSGKYCLKMSTTNSLHTTYCSYVRVTIFKSSLPPNHIHEIFLPG